MCVYVFVSERSFSVYMRLCDALSIEKVVICKSALPWAGGVKLGKQERKSVREGRERQTNRETDRETACE